MFGWVYRRSIGGRSESTFDINALVLKNHPGLSVSEVDVDEFNATPATAKETLDQADWKIEKAKGTAAAITFLAQQLGLE